MTASLTSFALLSRRFSASQAVGSHAIGADRSRRVTNTILRARRSTSPVDGPIPRRAGTTPRAELKTCQELFQLVPERVGARMQQGPRNALLRERRVIARSRGNASSDRRLLVSNPVDRPPPSFAEEPACCPSAAASVRTRSRFARFRGCPSRGASWQRRTATD
jgi:hypothetical protein